MGSIASTANEAKFAGFARSAHGGRRWSADPHQAREPAGGVGPGGGVAGLVDGDGERAGDDGAEVGDRAELLAADRLHQDVADRRGLDGPGVDRAAAGVGGELAEQRVLGPAADHVDRPDRRAQDRFQPLDRPAILERQALQAAADERPLVPRRRLAGLRAEGGQPRGHVTGGEE